MVDFQSRDTGRGRDDDDEEEEQASAEPSVDEDDPPAESAETDAPADETATTPETEGRGDADDALGEPGESVTETGSIGSTSGDERTGDEPAETSPESPSTSEEQITVEPDEPLDDSVQVEPDEPLDDSVQVEPDGPLDEGGATGHSDSGRASRPPDEGQNQRQTAAPPDQTQEPPAGEGDQAASKHGHSTEGHDHGATGHEQAGGGHGDAAGEHGHAHGGEQKTRRVAIVTISSTRTLDDDPSGDVVQRQLTDAGHELATRDVLRDDLDGIQSAVSALVDRRDVDAVITTGGTGVTPDDVTIEAVRPLFDKELPGFGELFRILSYEDVGTKAVATRATAGVVDDVVVFCLPGSEDAARLGTAELVTEELSHLVGLARRT